MRVLGRLRWSARAAAFIAVALLSFASVQSTLMQVAAGDPTSLWPICSAAGLSKSPAPASGDQTAHAVCGFCALAGQAPLLANPPSLLRPRSVIWVPETGSAYIGPAGPPRFRPVARGPPLAI